jgi:hypothetical protein
MYVAEAIMIATRDRVRIKDFFKMLEFHYWTVEK